MAKATNVSGSSNIWLGSKGNSRQSIVYIPASITAGSGTADKPGLLFLESITAAGGVSNLAGVFLWADNTGVLRYSTSVPTNEDGSGTALGASSGASLALDNLVSVQIADTLAFSSADTYDVGDDPDSIRTLYWTTSLKKIGTTYDVTLAATEPSGASYTYTFPDAGAAANVMLDTGAATGITYTKSTANITLGLAAKFDIAAAGNVDFGTGTYNFVGNVDVASGKTVDINGAVTIGTGGLITSTTAVTIDQDVQASASPTWVGLTLSGAIATPTTIALSSYLRLADDQMAEFGGEFDVDSYIKYDSTANKLVFYDRTVGSERTLSQLVAGTPLNPIVTGSLTISDGQFDWVNTATDEINTWDFGATTVDTFDIISDNTTAAFLDIEADSFTAHGTAADGLIDINVDGITSGNVIVIDTNQAGTFTGSYLKFYTDGSTDAFTVKGYGATTIAGVAPATAALTLTAGDFVMSDGQVQITDSTNTTTVTITDNTQSTTGNLLSLASSSLTSATALLITTNSGAAGMFIDCVNTGTKFSVDNDYGEVIIAGNDGGAASLTQTNGDHALSDGVITQTADSDIGNTFARSVAGSSNLMTLGMSNSGATGACLYIDNQTQGAGTAINVLHDGTGAIVALASSGTARAGEGLTLDVTNFEGENGISISGAYTGAAGKGALMIDIGTAVLAADSSLIRLEGSGNHAQHSAMQEIIFDTGTLAGATDGFCLQVTDSSSAAATSYAVNIASTSNEALRVTAGDVLFSEFLTVTKGVQASAAALTATVTTGVATPPGTSFVDLTVNTATHIIDLPAPIIGNVIHYVANGANAFELGPDTTTTYINGTLADASKTLTCAASGVVIQAVCSVTDRWIVTQISATGVPTGGGTPS